MSNLETFVREQLEKLPSRYGIQYKGDVAWIRCPTHGNGREKTPSRVVNLTAEARGGIGHSSCFGCGDNFNWNTFSKIVGLKPISKSELAKVEASVGLTKGEWGSILNEDEEELDLDFLRDSIPWPANDDWRSISGKLLSALNCRMFFDERKDDSMLFLPVCMFGERVGGVKALLRKKKKQLSYVNLKGNWAKQSLFPYDYVKDMVDDNGLEYTVIVEGPRDALWLVQQGIPALSFLGSSNAWSVEKENAILSLDVEVIVLGFDGDGAGRKAHNTVKKDLKGKVSKIMRLKMKEGEDPAMLTIKKLKRFRQIMENI